VANKGKGKQSKFSQTNLKAAIERLILIITPFCKFCMPRPPGRDLVGTEERTETLVKAGSFYLKFLFK
jgi:hypothetical protein